MCLKPLQAGMQPNQAVWDLGTRTHQARSQLGFLLKQLQGDPKRGISRDIGSIKCV